MTHWMQNFLRRKKIAKRQPFEEMDLCQFDWYDYGVYAPDLKPDGVPRAGKTVRFDPPPLPPPQGPVDDEAEKKYRAACDRVARDT